MWRFQFGFEFVFKMATQSSSLLSSDVEPATLIKQNINGKDVIYSLITIIGCVIGTIGNTLVIGALLVHTKLRVRSNVFIGNLAVADLCVSLVISPLNIVGVFYSNFYFIHYQLCEFIGFICIISCTASMWNIAAITINRYVAICCNNTLYHRIYNRKTIPFLVGGIWLLCFCIDLPNFVGWSDHTFNKRARLCLVDFFMNYSYTLYFVICGFVTPMFLVSVCYIRIILFARRSKQRLRKFCSNSDDSQLTRIKTTDLRMLRSIAITWLVFIIMWTPFCIIAIFDPGYWSSSFFAFATAFAHSNSSVNSIIYGATNPNFREGYVQFLQKIFSCFSCKIPNTNKSQRVVTVSSTGTSNID